MLNVHVIIGSTRVGRFSDKPAHWIAGELAQQPGVQATIIDLRDHPLPFYDSPTPPARLNGQYPHASVQAFSALMATADAFVMVAPEYNHGYTAVLKNALDWLFAEWMNKPVGFVSFGGAGGARVVEQLRQVAIELQMLPIKNGLHIPVEAYQAAVQSPLPVDPEIFNRPLRIRTDRVAAFRSELIKLGRIMQSARASGSV